MRLLTMYKRLACPMPNHESCLVGVLHILLVACQTLSSSAFVSSPIYGPSCFPVIISSVSVSRVSWLCPRCLQLCLPIYSLFCPMLPVDYWYCHMCQARVDVHSCVPSVCYNPRLLVPGSQCEPWHCYSIDNRQWICFNICKALYSRSSEVIGQLCVKNTLKVFVHW